jgi:hypothetical protein
MTAAPMGHSKSGTAWEVGSTSVKIYGDAVCSGEVVTLYENSYMRKLQEFDNCDTILRKDLKMCCHNLPRIVVQ